MNEITSRKGQGTEAGSGVAGILLAAGSSSRMGRLKQLLPVGGVPLAARAAGHAVSSALESVVVVLGYQSREIAEKVLRYCADPKLTVIENPHWREGISTSIITGLSAVEDRFDHVMILLGDMPHVPPSVIDLLLERYLDSGACMGAVVRGERRCHPVVFSREMYLHLHSLRGDVGARALFDAFPQRVCIVTPDAPYDPRDIDTPEDYSRLCGDLPPRG